MSGPALVAVELRRVRLPLVRPHRAAHGAEHDRLLVLVRAELADGTVGWGECSALARPTYTSEYTDGAWAVLRDLLAPAALAGRLEALVGHPFATAGLVGAIGDARLRAEGLGLAGALQPEGGEVPTELPWCAVIGHTDSIDEAHEVTGARLAAGASQLKIKVGPGERGLATVQALRGTWPDVSLAVDCNGTADVAVLEHLDRLDLAYIEQPAPARSLVQSAAWAAELETPIALDESIDSAESMDVAVALAAGTIVNLKPGRLGGPQAAARALALAANRGLGCFVGGMVESGIGRAAALAVAACAATGGVGRARPTDLGPSSLYVEEDVTAPIVLGAAGGVEVPTGPGIGREPDPARLAAVTADHLRLTA